MRPSSKGTYEGWLLFEKVTQDMRLILGYRSEQLSIGLISLPNINMFCFRTRSRRYTDCRPYGLRFCRTQSTSSEQLMHSFSHYHLLVEENKVCVWGEENVEFLTPYGVRSGMLLLEVVLYSFEAVCDCR